MDEFQRYAIYAVPDDALAAFGRDWLGWDLATGRPAPQMAVPGLPRPLADMTRTAAPYGLHATIKPPFRLAAGHTMTGLQDEMAALAARLAPVQLAGLALTDLEGFLALTPSGDVTALNALAARIVQDLDAFRAPAPPDELARRRAAGLTVRQEANLVLWGYPYVMDDFGFHITLTDRLEAAEMAQTRALLAPLLQDKLPAPFHIDRLALVGHLASGGFRTIHVYTLTG